MVKYDTHELLKFRNFGKKSLVEIEELLLQEQDNKTGQNSKSRNLEFI